MLLFILIEIVLFCSEANNVKSLFTSEAYVKSEFHYHAVTKKHAFDASVLKNWTLYLGKIIRPKQSYSARCAVLLVNVSFI